MSETLRDEAGQFAAPEPQLYGRDEAAAKQGYTTRQDDPPIANSEIYTADEDGLRQAADNLAARRAEPEVPLTVADVLSIDPDAKESLTPEQAAQDRTNAAAVLNTFTEGTSLQRLADEIDAKRAEVIDGDPKRAEKLGVEMPKDPALTKAEKAQADEIDAIDGLDPETRRALKIPQVRQAFDEEFSKIETVQRAYGESLSHANTYSHAAILAIAPELQGVPLDRWAEGVQILAQSDPARGQQLGNLLNYVGQVQGAQAQWQQQQAQVHHQQFEAVRQQYSRASDAALGPMTRAEKAAMADELVEYVGNYGISREQLASEAQTNLALHHPAFQRMAADAIKWQRMQKAPKANPTRAIPPVSKPGNSATPRASDKSVKLESLQKQLSSASGEKALRLASQIRQMRRAS